MKDLYHILNLNKSATDTEIKKSYRKLAFQCHPDKNKAEDAKLQFENISEAYDILSKPDKRRIYDQFGYEAVSESRPQINPMDLFQSLFNVDFMNMSEKMDSNIFIFSDLSSNPFTQLKHKMTYNLEATLDELYHGTKKEFEIHHRLPNHSMKSTSYIINIKKGSKHGDNIVVKEGGNYIPELKSTEDLVIQIIEKKHPFYQRKNNDLYIEHKISLIDSLCGCQFTIDHFDEKLTIEIKDIIKPNSMFQVFQKGMPIKKDDIKSLTDSSDSDKKEYGTLIIDLQIIYPDEISEKQIHYLKKIFNVKHEKESNDNSVIAYYYKDKEDAVKELMNEEEESSSCIQQ
jgi:curved DNA-binding protein